MCVASQLQQLLACLAFGVWFAEQPALKTQSLIGSDRDGVGKSARRLFRLSPGKFNRDKFRTAVLTLHRRFIYRGIADLEFQSCAGKNFLPDFAGRCENDIQFRCLVGRICLWRVPDEFVDNIELTKGVNIWLRLWGSY